MRSTKLILVEGIPGSGKSSTAQFIADQIARQGIAVRWWYEEELGNPVYVFGDAASMNQVVEDLAAGQHLRVIDAALAKWQELADALRVGDGVVVFESVLFGYLTWTLFHFDVPPDEIRDYVARVEQILRPLDPTLVNFQQDDVADVFRGIFAARGDRWEQSFIRDVAESPYSKRRGFQGFDGLVAFWTNYQVLVGEMFQCLGLAKLRIENPARDWPATRRQILEFLDLTYRERSVGDGHLGRFAGAYDSSDGDAEKTCRIVEENGGLVALNLPGLWPRNRLLPRLPAVFDVEAYPARLSFETDGSGVIRRMRLSGPELVEGKIERLFAKRSAG